MAARMVEIVKNKGRAYRCNPCGFISRKCRIEEHFYKQHVTEHQVPYMCVVCEFRTGDNTKFVRHQSSTGHLEKVDPVQNLIALQESSSPRYMAIGQDVTKLSREDSAEHWLAVGYESEGNSTPKSGTVEDIRSQLLTHEPMQLTPPNSGESEVHVPKQQPGNSVVAEKKFKNAAAQTEAVTPEDVSMLQKIDSNLSFMYAQTREAVSVMYNTLENFKVINRRQEEVILRMEKRLEKYEEKEKKEEQDREERRRREE